MSEEPAVAGLPAHYRGLVPELALNLYGNGRGAPASNSPKEFLKAKELEGGRRPVLRCKGAPVLLRMRNTQRVPESGWGMNQGTENRWPRVDMPASIETRSAAGVRTGRGILA